MARAPRHSGWTLAAALLASVALHPAVGFVVDALHTPPPPRLVVVVQHEGKGKGVVTSSDGDIHCDGARRTDEHCMADLEPGERVRLTATRGEKSTFRGWDGPCGPQSYKVFGWALDALYGDPNQPLPEPGTPRGRLYRALLAQAHAPPPSLHPLECQVELDHSVKVTALFGEVPDEVSVKWVAMNDAPDKNPDRAITLPDPTIEAQNLPRVEPPRPEPKQPRQPKLQPQKMPELAKVKPPPPQPPPTPVQPQPAKTQKKKVIEAHHMKSVEVPDDTSRVLEKAPDDARFLSDKNRDVEKETIAKDTNLERQQKGKVAASEKSDVKSEDVGGEKDRIHQLETSEQSSLDDTREKDSTHSGHDKIAKGVQTGKGGENGEGGQNGNGGPSTKPGMLSMRGIEGRGAPGGPVVAEEHDNEGGGQEGQGGKRGRRGKRGTRGIKTQLAFEDYERIVGHDKAEKEMHQLARRTKSIRRGRWEAKMAAIRSSLENFTPEVRPGNQTALKTRAAPFAVYIAGMHRRIHELWGFGFLEDLDKKPASNPMNNWNLWTQVEIVINPDGTVDKVNIVHPSGVLPFDVAALDTVLSAGPFDPPPEAIRSADGKTYMHWAFHRNWEQCGTFNVDPYILTTPPKGGKDKGLDDSSVLSRVPRRGRAHGGGAEAGHGGGAEAGQGAGRAASDDPTTNAARARAQAAVSAPDDPRATFAANIWLTGFTHGNVNKMMQVTALPFAAGGGMVAQSGSEVGNIYRNILTESRGKAVSQFKIFSPAGYRKALGALPEDANPAPGDLFLVVRLRGEQFTVLLREHGNEYRAVGFFR